jgi:hypothetical protein
MLAQKLVRQRQGAGIVFEVGKKFCLPFCAIDGLDLSLKDREPSLLANNIVIPFGGAGTSGESDRED